MRAEHDHNANQYISALLGAAHRVKEQSVSGTNTPFFFSLTECMCLRACVCERVSNVNGKDVRSTLISTHLDSVFSHTVFFNHVVSRLLLSVAAARGAPLSDSDADQRAMGRPGAGGEIRAREIPHTHRLEVRLHVYVQHKSNDTRKLI